jgi:[ribosomal protein S5]-alanine N-acetyltransferase
VFSGPDPGPINDIVVTTERLSLRPPSIEDVEGLFALIGGADRARICEGLLWEGPDSPDDIAGWVERHRRGDFYEEGFAWVIHFEDSPAGTIGLRPRYFPGRCLVGYWLGTSYWRKGIMQEALTAALDLAFTRLGMRKVEAEVFASNAAGRRLVERIGMRQEALFRRAVLKRGEWLDEAVYGILAEEWPVRM